MPPPRHSVVPEFLLRRFADASGRVLMERRDRARRRTATVAEAAAEAGFWTVGAAEGGSPDLVRLLGRIEERAATLIEPLLAGAFPPRGEERRYLAAFVAVRLLLGRGPRTTSAHAVAVLDHLLVSNLPESQDEPEGALAPAVESASDRGHLLVHDEQEPVRLTLATVPPLARVLAARTWQLLRFPSPQLLTGDTPAVPWSPSRAAPPFLAGLGASAEVRVPLDPRHALILARTAPAGEVVRELGSRHARALNRTVADAAGRWIYCHPDSDPLGGVELDPA